MMKHTPPRKISRRTFLKAGAAAAATMACAGALSACWVPAGSDNGDIVVTEKSKTIDGVKYTMSVDLITGVKFNLSATAGEGVTVPTFTKDKFRVSLYSDKAKKYYIQDTEPDWFDTGTGNSCQGCVYDSTVRNAAGINYWDTDFTTNDRIEVKYQLASGKNIIWKIRVESTAVTKLSGQG